MGRTVIGYTDKEKQKKKTRKEVLKKLRRQKDMLNDSARRPIHDMQTGDVVFEGRTVDKK